MSLSSRTDLIRSLLNDPVTEPDAVSMFDWGMPSAPDHWDVEDLRKFLVDLCIASDRAPVVPDEVVETALRELQLDANEQGCISKMEWKSFFLYLLDSPLKHLEATSFKSFPNPSSQAPFPSQTVIISLTGPNAANLTKITAQSAIRKAIGPMLFFAFAKCSSLTSILAVFETPILVETALSLRELPTLDITDCSVLRYEEGNVFPDWAQESTPSPTTAGFVAKALASTVLFGAMVGSQAKSLDERVGFSATAKTAYASTKETVSDADDRLGISRNVKDVAGKVDNSLHISEVAATASKKTSEAVGHVKQTQPAQTTMSYVGGLFGKLKSVAGNLKAETETAIEQKRSEK